MGKLHITKTRLYNFDPLQPHFYIVKLGFTGVYIIFLISAQKHRLGVLVRTASEFFIWKFSFSLVVKFSIYLNRRVFIMNRHYKDLRSVRVTDLEIFAYESLPSLKVINMPLTFLLDENTLIDIVCFIAVQRSLSLCLQRKHLYQNFR